jgi:hypothetical protein
MNEVHLQIVICLMCSFIINFKDHINLLIQCKMLPLSFYILAELFLYDILEEDLIFSFVFISHEFFFHIKVYAFRIQFDTFSYFFYYMKIQFKNF